MRLAEEHLDLLKVGMTHATTPEQQLDLIRMDVEVVTVKDAPSGSGRTACEDVLLEKSAVRQKERNEVTAIPLLLSLLLDGTLCEHKWWTGCIVQ